ncbi:mannonate dehydratase, partial [Acidianus sp. RZ1]
MFPRIAEIILEESPVPFWDWLKQVGVKEAVGLLPRSPPDWRKESIDTPWSYSSLSKYKRMLGENGLKLVAIEDNPPMTKVKLGLPGKEEELDAIAKMIENMGKLGIELWCYNWMPLGWIRTRTGLAGRGGSRVTGYFHDDLKEDPPPYFGKVDSSTLWKSLKDFLDYIVPIAEQSNVKLAMHPDDPPVDEVRGVARIMNSVESYDRLLSLKKSDYNGITLCQGNFTLMTDDLPATIRHFNNKIFFVHFRDVKGNKYNFVETFIDEGKTDLVKVARAYREIKFDGIMRTDHTPTLT